MIEDLRSKTNQKSYIVNHQSDIKK